MSGRTRGSDAKRGVKKALHPPACKPDRRRRLGRAGKLVAALRKVRGKDIIKNHKACRQWMVDSKEYRARAHKKIPYHYADDSALALAAAIVSGA